MTKVIKSYSSSFIIITEKLKWIIILLLTYSGTYIWVQVYIDENKSTIHVTLATQVYTLDRPWKNRWKKNEQKKKNM